MFSEFRAMVAGKAMATALLLDVFHQSLISLQVFKRLMSLLVFHKKYKNSHGGRKK